MIRLFFLALFILLLSCTQFVKSTDGDYFVEKLDNNANELQIYFSHNINGETHPCGCRNFPLGGIPQVFGEIKSEQMKQITLYVDSGDTFFPLPFVPTELKKSTTFTANKIAEALDEMGLNYFTPGDQDFALGEEFLVQLAKKHKFQFLISNASGEMKIPHKKIGIIKSNQTSFYLIGITDPKLLQPEYAKLYTSPMEAIQIQLDYITKQSGNKKIILLSHSGIEEDKIIAQRFPQINWIIGAHSQSYLYEPVNENKTQIVQTLSRNHFIGKITLPLRSELKDSYELVEIRDEKKDLVKNNKMVVWLEQYKAELEKIQESEQASVVTSAEHKYLPTFMSCSECHAKQVEFWQQTSHSLAIKTLIDAKAFQNQTCIQCHSVGYKDPKGFLTTKKIILSENENFDLDKYWNEFNSKLDLKGKSLRKLKSNERLELSKAQMQLNKKHEITHDFANVQCINCHNQTAEHPFDVANSPSKPDYQKACLNCHTPDQSPEWYNKDGKNLATSLNSKYFQQKLKLVSCPKIERN